MTEKNGKGVLSRDWQYTGMMMDDFFEEKSNLKSGQKVELSVREICRRIFRDIHMFVDFGIKKMIGFYSSGGMY